IRDANNLYLSFEVNNDQRFDDEDVIVLAIDPSGTPADCRRIHIYPVFAGVGAQGGGDPREVDYWTNSSTWNTGAPSGPLPVGVVIKCSSQLGGPNNVSWFVEVSLPLAQFDIPAAGDFGLYFNILRTS